MPVNQSRMMTPEQLFHSLLGLGTQWRVERCEYDMSETPGIVRIWVEETPALWAFESVGAKEEVAAYDHTEEMEY